MTYTILVFLSRKSSLTSAQFRTYWNTVHVPLLQSVAGEDFPLSHTRRFIDRDDTDNSITGLMQGKQEDFDWDGCAEVVCKDAQHLGRFVEKLSADKRVREDEERFCDMERGLRVVVLGDVQVTMGPGGQ